MAGDSCVIPLGYTPAVPTVPIPMNYIERTVCPSCKRQVLLSYVPTGNEAMRDSEWTCPHCKGKHPSKHEGTVVVAVRATRRNARTSSP